MVRGSMNIWTGERKRNRQREVREGLIEGKGSKEREREREREREIHRKTNPKKK